MRRRRVATLSVIAVLAFITVGASLWLWRDDSDRAFVAGLGSLINFAVFIAVYLGTRRMSELTTEDSLQVHLRSQDGHPRLSRRWSQAQIWPTPGALRITPFAGASVAPFTVDATGLEVLDDPRTWRDALTGPVGAGAFVRVPTDEGTLEIALPADRLPWLRENLAAPDDPQEP